MNDFVTVDRSRTKEESYSRREIKQQNYADGNFSWNLHQTKSMCRRNNDFFEKKKKKRKGGFVIDDSAVKASSWRGLERYLCNSTKSVLLFQILPVEYTGNALLFVVIQFEKTN